MKKSSILVVGPNTDMKVHGGIVTHMNLMLSLSGFKEFDYNILTYTVGNRSIVGEKLKGTRLLKEIIGYSKILVFSKIKVVHINASMKNGSILKNCALLILAKLFFNKTVFQFHGGAWNDISKNYRFVLKIIMTLSDMILVLTNDQMRLNSYLLQGEKKKIQKVPNFIKKQDEIIERSTKKYVVKFLFVGRIIKEKGIFEIIDASYELAELNMRFRIDILGDGPDLALCKETVINKGLEKFFNFHGFVNDSKYKNSIYCNSDAFLFPSYYKEGFPYAILEAMSFAMPVISSGQGAILDIIKEGINGFIIPVKDSKYLSDKMKYLILNRGDLKNMGINSYDIIDKKYSTDKMALTFNNIYNILL